MSEYRVNFNSLLQNIRYLLSALTDKRVEKLQGALEQSNLGGSGLMGDIMTGAGKGLLGLIGDIRGGLTKLPGLGGDFNTNTVANYLKPYYGLYGATPTGFEYYFPHFEADWKTIDSKWADWQGGGGFLSEAYSNFFSKQGFLKTIESTALLSPNVLGASIERPKSYTYGASEPSVDVKLELLNTADEADVIRNWQLIYLLLYQNLPNKTNKVMLEPPVIYEVEIPGSFYTPYAYISNLKITNRGATRLMRLPYLIEKDSRSERSSIGGTMDNNMVDSRRRTIMDVNIAELIDAASRGIPLNSAGPRSTLIHDTLIGVRGNSSMFPFHPKDIPGTAGKPGTAYTEAIIPDAWQIQFTLQSLLPDSKNLFFHSLLGSEALTTGIYKETYSDPSMRGGKGSSTFKVGGLKDVKDDQPDETSSARVPYVPGANSTLNEHSTFTDIAIAGVDPHQSISMRGGRWIRNWWNSRSQTQSRDGSQHFGYRGPGGTNPSSRVSE